MSPWIRSGGPSIESRHVAAYRFRPLTPSERYRNLRRAQMVLRPSLYDVSGFVAQARRYESLTTPRYGRVSRPERSPQPRLTRLVAWPRVPYTRVEPVSSRAEPRISVEPFRTAGHRIPVVQRHHWPSGRLTDLQVPQYQPVQRPWMHQPVSWRWRPLFNGNRRVASSLVESGPSG